MKKTVAILAALVMVLAVAVTGMAEESSAPALLYGAQFSMSMDDVMKLMNLPNSEIDRENTRGPVSFMELEYENVADEQGKTADVKFLFIDDTLVAIHLDTDDKISYETVRADLAKTYGEPVPFDAAKIGNGKYAVDDDGDLKNCVEMIAADGVVIVLEKDHDGDVDLTLLNPAAFL